MSPGELPLPRVFPFRYAGTSFPSEVLRCRDLPIITSEYMSTRPLTIGYIPIGREHPTVIIAEVACEHRGNMEAAKRLIRAAKDAGADVVKFQLHVPGAEMLPNQIRFWAGSMDEILREVNFPHAAQHRELMASCTEIGIQYLCTPFCEAAVDVLEELAVPAYKVGSGELTNLPMHRKIARICARRDIPAIISTGMSIPEEIAETVAVYEDEGVKDRLILMNCTSEYPATYEHAHLGLIPEFRERFGVIVGQSDHSTEIYTAIAAVTLGAKVVEKHLTIRDLHGPDDLVSLDPEQFRQMVDAIHKIGRGLGTEKFITEAEGPVRAWAHHSVAVIRGIRAGEPITPTNVAVRRPGGGIPAKYFDQRYAHELIGKLAKRDLAPNMLLQWEDLEGVDLTRVQRTSAGDAVPEVQRADA